MIETKKHSQLNNTGFSLIELIIVIAIIGVLSASVVLSVSLVGNAHAKTCCNDLQSAIADCKVTTLGKSRAWLSVYQGDNGYVYSQLHVYQLGMGDGKEDATDIPEEPQRLGGKRVTVSYTDETGAEMPLPVGAENGIRIEFDRSSGSFKEAPQTIIISGGNRKYTLEFIELTGKLICNNEFREKGRHEENDSASETE